MEINLFFDKNREVQKSLSFKEGNGVYHSLSYYLEANKVAAEIYKTILFFNKLNISALNNNPIRGVYKKYINIFETSDATFFEAMKDKLQFFSELLLLDSDNNKKNINYNSYYIFGIKNMTLSINEDSESVTSNSKGIEESYNYLSISPKDCFQSKIYMIKNIMTESNSKSILKYSNEKYIESRIKSSDINNYWSMFDTLDKEMFKLYTLQLESDIKNLNKNEYYYLVDTESKELNYKESDLSVGINSKILNSINDYIQLDKTNLNIVIDEYHQMVSNSFGKESYIMDVDLKQIDKYRNELFDINSICLNNNNKNIYTDDILKNISKYSKKIYYQYIFSIDKNKNNIFKYDNSYNFSKNSKDAFYLNNNIVSKNSHIIDTHDMFRWLYNTNRKIDIDNSHKKISKQSRYININNDEIFASVVHSDKRNSIFIPSYDKTFIVNNKKIDFNKKLITFDRMHISIFETAEDILVSKYNKPIYKVDNLKASKYENNIIGYVTDISISKYNKGIYYLNNINVNLYNKNTAIYSDSSINLSKYIKHTSFNEIYDIQFSKNIKNSFIIDDFPTFNKSWKNTMIDDEIILYNKSYKNSYMEYELTTFNKLMKDAIIEYDVLGFNKNPKSMLDLDDLLMFNKFPKDIVSYNYNIEFSKNPKSLFETDNYICINKMNKGTYINKNFINILKHDIDITVFTNIDYISALKTSNRIYNNDLIRLYKDKYKSYTQNTDFNMFRNKLDFGVYDNITLNHKIYNTAIDDNQYTFDKHKKDTRLDYDSPFITVIHYDGDMKPDLGDGKVDELILPHNDFDYSQYLSKLINDDGTINMLYVKKYDSENDSYTVTLPIENPMDIYKDIGREYVDLNTNTLEILIYIIRTLWKDNMFKYMAMSAQDSLKDIIVKSDEYINKNYTLDKDRRYEFDRCLQLFRWYSEMAILNNCEYELKFNTKTESVNYITRDLGSLKEMIDLDNMHISEDYILETINTSKPCSVTFKNNKKNILSNPNLHFTLYNINTKSSISITDKENSTDTVVYDAGMYNIEYKLENEITINFNPSSEKQSIALAKISIDNIQLPSFSVEYKGVFGEMNSVMKDLLKQLLVVGDTVPQNVQDKLKDVTPVTSAVSKMQEYFEIHHKDKDKGKRIITKK